MSASVVKYDALELAPRPPHHIMSATGADSDTLSVAWVDVSPLTRESMSQAVSSLARELLIIPFDSVSNCVFCSDRTFDVIVYYSHNRETVSVADVTWLRETFPSTGLIVLSDAIMLPQDVVKSIMTQGVSGFILARHATLNMVVSSLGLVASGGMSIAREFLLGDWQPEREVSRQPAGRSQLTKREVEVLAILKQGKSDKLIANALNLSVSTAKIHVRNLIRKMGAANRTQAAMSANEYLDA
jgi:DNA-binding NarL/FixJ family response regulator